jgi:transposase
MLNVEGRFMIRELYRKGVTVSEIARRTGHDRKTIRAALQGPLQPPPQKRRPKPQKLDAFVPYLEQRIEDGIVNCNKLFAELRSQGYTGSYGLVKNFVRPYRPSAQPRATVRFETAPGQQAQVDWGYFGFITHQGRRQRLYAFVMTLGWSRMLYVEFMVATDVAHWLRGHLHAFQYFGGLPAEVLHDNIGSPATWTSPATMASRRGPANPTARRPRAKSNAQCATCAITSGPACASRTWPTSTARCAPGSMTPPTCECTAPRAKSLSNGWRWNCCAR